MSFLALIEAKRDGQHLTADQIRQFVSEYTAGRIPDYQAAAFLMAIFFRGMDLEETRALTLAIRDSGDLLGFPKEARPLVDKHSTGGVGDKVSLPLAPLLACLGFRVPMISGRGLGITGGTLDKLDSIPGFQTSLPAGRIVELVQKVGCVICGQTERMVPADRGLYALRDVTGTVASVPLIVASILSKKLAEGLEALVLDVKFGAAAFMPGIEQARELARGMVDLGKQCGVNTRALLSRMDAPLGHSAGNWLEIKEAVECLSGIKGGDFRTLVLECAANLLVQTGKSDSLTGATKAAEDCLLSGRPLAKWEDMIAAQGARMSEYREKLLRETTAAVVREVKAAQNGFVTRCDAKTVGELVRDLGGGRLTRESQLDYDSGIEHLVAPGTLVRYGSVLGRVHASDVGQASAACERLQGAFTIREERLEPAAIIAEVIR